MLLEKKLLTVWLKGFLLGTTCLIAPNALANPSDGENFSFPPTEIAPNLSSCPSFTPITNTLEPKETPQQETRIPPTSACAADLIRVSEPKITQETPEPEPLENPPPDSIQETAPPETSERGWRIYFQPYATIPVSTYGAVTVKGRTVDYSLGLGEVLDVLRVALSGRVEAWNGNLGFIVDGYYASLGGSGIQDARRPNVEANLESNLTFDQGIYDFAVSYNLGAQPIAYNPDQPSDSAFPRVWFQPYVGTRLNDINSTIETTLTFPRLGRVRVDSVSAGRTWFEPLVGGKLGIQVSEPLAFWLRGDASGFGLAGETDMSWNIIFGIDWWVHRQISLQFAYRFYEISYGNGSGNNAFKFQESFNGPYLSATFRF